MRGRFAAPAAVAVAVAVAFAFAFAFVGLVAAPAAQGATGDWEASGAGAARASFALTTSTTGHGRAAHKLLTDLVVQAPIACTDPSGPVAPVDVEVIPSTLNLGPSGRFATGAIRGGSGTTVTGSFANGRVTIFYRHVSSTANAFDGGTTVCDTKTVTLTGAPGHRPSIGDQTWQGQTATNEPVALNVVAGGRALQEPAHVPAGGGAQAAIEFGAFTQSCFTGGCTPSSNDICAYYTPATLFVAAGGSFGNDAEGDQAAFTGRFTSARAVGGTFVNGGEGCEQTTWTATPG